jgi:hypothetical protein
MDVLNNRAVTEPPHLTNLTDLLLLLQVDAAARGVTPVPVDQFLPPEAIDQLRLAHDWWPRDAPQNLSWAVSLGGSLSMYAAPGNTMTLMDHLGLAYARVVRWLESEGRPTDHPNESRADRMRRLNRERVARYRERAAAPSAAKLAWDEVVKQREIRRINKEHADKEVRRHHDAMMLAVEQRRTLMEKMDARVAAAEEAHRAARGLAVADPAEVG